MPSFFPVTHSTLSVSALAAEVLPAYALGPIRWFRFQTLGLNDTYVLTLTSGTQYVLRVYRAHWRTPADIACEMDVLLHLGRKGQAVSQPVPRADGQLVQTLPAPEGPRPVVLFTYAPGTPFTYGANAAAEAHAYGHAIAHLHNALQDFASPHARLALDLAHLLEAPLQALQPWLAHRQSDWAYLQRRADQLRQQLVALPSPALHAGFCHGDLAAGNAHVAADGTLTFFDFDSGGWGWQAYDLAVFLWAARTGGKAEVCWEPFLRGYTAARALPALDRQALPFLADLRQFWHLGLRASNGDEWGFSKVTDAFFDRALQFLRVSEAAYPAA